MHANLLSLSRSVYANVNNIEIGSIHHDMKDSINLVPLTFALVNLERTGNESSHGGISGATLS